MMNREIAKIALDKDFARFFEEDDLRTNQFYMESLPGDMVKCSLKIKSEMILAGMPWFIGAFSYLGFDIQNEAKLLEQEGKFLDEGKNLKFKLPFNIALTGERIALNLLQRASAIATYTNQYCRAVEDTSIRILDTRKTTPGLRNLEKYAVRVGGGFNHRFSQTDAWMVKDNHKAFFGSLQDAYEFFENMQGFYTPVVVEIHNLDELEQGLELGINHFMLDNFSPEDVRRAITLKRESTTFEVSGGITLDNIDTYLIEGIDAFSVGSLTYNAPAVDISLKYERV